MSAENTVAVEARGLTRIFGEEARQVTWLLFSEAAALGVIGTAVGIPLGLAAAFVMTHLMAQLSGPVVPELQLTAGPFVLAGLLGPGVAMLATYLPAKDAGRRSPLAGYDGHRGWVYYVAVKPGFRRQGIGSVLMRHVEDTLADLGCPKLNLQVRAANDEVIAFYEELGHEVEKRVSMRKRLQPICRGQAPSRT